MSLYLTMSLYINLEHECISLIHYHFLFFIFYVKARNHYFPFGVRYSIFVFKGRNAQLFLLIKLFNLTRII